MIGGFESRQGLGILLHTTVSRPGLGPTKPPIQCVPGVLSRGVTRPGRDADHSPPSSVQVKNGWSYTSTPQYAFMAWCSIKTQGLTLTLPCINEVRTVCKLISPTETKAVISRVARQTDRCCMTVLEVQWNLGPIDFNIRPCRVWNLSWQHVLKSGHINYSSKECIWYKGNQISIILSSSTLETGYKNLITSPEVAFKKSSLIRKSECLSLTCT
jgi:hypothetical protein